MLRSEYALKDQRITIYIYIEKNAFNIQFWELVIRKIMWVRSVCLCAIYGTRGLNWLVDRNHYVTTNSTGPGQTSRYVLSHLSSLCLYRYHLWDALLRWVTLNTVNTGTSAKSADLDQMPRYAASHRGPNCLFMCHCWTLCLHGLDEHNVITLASRFVRDVWTSFLHI